jgi:hypothetical protein
MLRTRNERLEVRSLENFLLVTLPVTFGGR